MGIAVKRNLQTTAMILDAAQREFSHFGFKKVTMDEIAREVDMGKASLYYYFRTKENLFHAVITREHQRFMTSVGAKLESAPSAREKVTTYVLERSEYFNKLLNLNILDVRSSVKMKPLFAEMFDKFSKRELRLLQKIILEGRMRGEFTVRSEEKVARALLHTLQGLRIQFLRVLDGPRVDEKQFERLKQEQQFVTEIFLRGIKKNGSGVS